MLKRNTLLFLGFSIVSSIFISCSSQEYTTAKLAIQQSDFKKATEWLPKAMAVEPDNPEIPVVMAVEIYAENDQWSDFTDMFNKAMTINSEKIIEVRGAFAPVKDAVKNYTEFYWAKEFNAGVEQFKKIQDDPENRISYLETAILHFTNASIINPKDVNTHVTLAKCYFDKGDEKSAKKSAISAVKTNPDSFDANFGAAQILRRVGLSSSDLLTYYQKAVLIEPSNSRALRELASTYYDLGQKDKSISVFEDAIINEKDEIVKADLYFNLGVIHNQTGNYEEAEKSFDEAFYLNEDDFEAALGMARAYEGIGDNFLNGSEGFDKDLDKAARWFRKAEKKIRSVMIIDIDNKDIYKKNLDIIRFKRDIAEGVS